MVKLYAKGCSIEILQERDKHIIVFAHLKLNLATFCVFSNCLRNFIIICLVLVHNFSILDSRFYIIFDGKMIYDLSYSFSRSSEVSRSSKMSSKVEFSDAGALLRNFVRSPCICGSVLIPIIPNLSRLPVILHLQQRR